MPWRKWAADLRTVLQLADGKRVVLVGHSIGGMVSLTFCGLLCRTSWLTSCRNRAGGHDLHKPQCGPPKTRDSRLHFKNPSRNLYFHAIILLAPVVRCLNWLSYQNGLAQLYNAHSSFGGSETLGQIDFVSEFQYRSSPAVVARGTLAMFHWDATPALQHVNTPVLIWLVIRTARQFRREANGCSNRYQGAVAGSHQFWRTLQPPGTESNGERGCSAVCLRRAEVTAEQILGLDCSLYRRASRRYHGGQRFSY